MFYGHFMNSYSRMSNIMNKNNITPPAMSTENPSQKSAEDTILYSPKAIIAIPNRRNLSRTVVMMLNSSCLVNRFFMISTS